MAINGRAYGHKYSLGGGYMAINGRRVYGHKWEEGIWP